MDIPEIDDAVPLPPFPPLLDGTFPTEPSADAPPPPPPPTYGPDPLLPPAFPCGGDVGGVFPAPPAILPPDPSGPPPPEPPGVPGGPSLTPAPPPVEVIVENIEELQLVETGDAPKPLV